MTGPVLVVDDAALIREPIAAALRLAGLEAHCAADGREALALIGRLAPAMVLLDLEMPGLSGLDVLRRLQTAPEDRRPAVIVLTAYSDRRNVLRAAELGAKHFLLKSAFSLEDLLQRVRTLLASDGLPSQAAATSAESSRVAATQTPSGATPSLPGNEPADPKEIRPMLTALELNQRLKGAGRLSALSPAVASVLELAESAHATAESIAGAIKRDPVLALKVLQLANSCAYARDKKAESVEEAVIRIGVGAIRQAVLNISVIESFGSEHVAPGVNSLDFWEHSIACAVISAELERSAGPIQAEAAFTAGLLHDVGRLILADRLGDLYAAVVETARATGQPLETVESRMLSANHAEIMPDLLRAWNVPPTFIEPIATHHGLRLGRGGATNAKQLTHHPTLVLRLADALAHAMCLGCSGNDLIYPIDGLCEELGIAPEALREIERIAQERTADVKLALLAAATPSAAAKAAAPAPSDPAPSIRFVGLEPDTDAHRVLCDRLSGSDATQVVAVMHLRREEELERLAQAYEAITTDPGALPPPLLVIAPDGVEVRHPRLTPAVRAVLRTPIAASRLRSLVMELAREGEPRAAAA